MGMSSGDRLSKKGTQDDSGPNRNAFNAERAARHARKLQKASSQGAAQPPTPSNQVSEAHKVRLGTQGDDVIPIRRKAGSGTRVEQKAADSTNNSMSQLMSNQNFTVNKAFISKPSFVGKASQRNGKDNGSGIILNNVKGGNIRQIKDMGSNPGSRVGSQKANVRAGD